MTVSFYCKNLGFAYTLTYEKLVHLYIINSFCQLQISDIVLASVFITLITTVIIYSLILGIVIASLKFTRKTEKR